MMFFFFFFFFFFASLQETVRPEFEQKVRNRRENPINKVRHLNTGYVTILFYSQLIKVRVYMS